MKLKYVVIMVILLSFFAYSKSEDELPKLISSAEAWKDKKLVRFQHKLSIGTDDFDKENYIFGWISDIAVDKEGCIYVLDVENFRVQKYSAEGKFMWTFGGRKGQGPGEFSRPGLIALDSQKNLYVTDPMQSRITIFNPIGKVIKMIKTRVMPSDIVVGKNGKIYITGLRNLGDFSIFEYSFSTGLLERSFCKNREEKELIVKCGQINRLCIDKEGNIYHSFFYPYYIGKYSPDGSLLNSFARKASFYKPLMQSNLGTWVYRAGTFGILSHPDGKIINVVIHRGRDKFKAEKKNIYFDVFDKNGKWLLSFPSNNIDSNWNGRVVSIDLQGDIYLDFRDPYPHVRKYSMEFVNK